METNKLGQKLKELRALRAMSQEYLAEESRVSLRTVQRIENNESTPTGETLKRIASALDVDLTALLGTDQPSQTNDVKATIIYLKKQLANSSVKSEVKTFEKFISLLENLKDKDLNSQQQEAIDSYLRYLELEKIPSISNEVYKQKFTKFKKFLKSKLRFVPEKYYTTMGFSFAISFVVGLLVTKAIGLEFILIGAAIIITCVFMDLRIKSQGRALRF
ncbi:helix-turn-helix domain-containing protein [Gilvibacter sediminis]|uniref:helix-turn-helix domain-containing protein n=1 Tax=Gilvibacter sediminis TaxID=379071 RepID=UPI00234FC17E|nr:helix-turn-helix transcriptional regulator [Gilvibacter sediminis]MDC7998027.1 helix-turn-helix transcriptional regulator [Gilvibacter sediminis]